jgi:hypothetical protein
MAAQPINLSQIRTTLASIQAVAFGSGAVANSAYSIWQQLNGTLTDYTAQTAAFSSPASPNFAPWLNLYTPSASELDRASRFAVVQTNQPNSAVIPIVQAAFGVPPLGVPVPIVVDTTTATHDAINARYIAALVLVGQPGATCITPGETPAGISTWLASANVTFAQYWASKPAVPDPSQTPAFLAATSALFFAHAAALTFLGATGFQ